MPQLALLPNASAMLPVGAMLVWWVKRAPSAASAVSSAAVSASAKPGEIYFAQHQSLLVVANSANVCQSLAARLTGSSAPTIGDDAVFAADGTPIELDDELREAEAIVVVAGGPVRAVARTVVPGVAVASTRAAFDRAQASGETAAWTFVREAEVQAPIDLLVWWDDAGEVCAASGRYALEGFATGCRMGPR